MNPIRRLACLATVILLCSCLIQGELLWIKEMLQTQMPSESSGKTEFDQYGDIVESVWEELVCFPVPLSEANPQAQTDFQNTWQAERNYGGKRVHEGCDIMAAIDKSGYYPVVSITDGTVEKVGWLEKGGWRIGIRSSNGNYYYYAHLHSYAKQWIPGDSVRAGEMLGYMGDSGYGPEGTKGQFPVHLHLGIYVPLGADRETPINPYWMLKYLENSKLNYSY